MLRRYALRCTTALALAACGGNGDASTAASTDASTSTGTATTGGEPPTTSGSASRHRRFDLPLEVLDVHLVGRTLLASAVDGVDLITARVTPIVSHDCMHCRIRLYG
jgi:hypothetical protein